MPDPGSEYGFDLRSVSWGYRRIFAETIRRLLDEGDIGPARERVTRTFFDMLRRSRPGSFDFALKEFLGALNPRTRWLLELPALFEDVCDLGRELAEAKLAHGIAFFRQWGAGGLGRTPEEVAALLKHVRRLRRTDPELAQGLIAGYADLLERLDLDQVRRFVNYLLEVHRVNPRTAVDSASLKLKSALAFVANLTQEARLDDLHDRLERLARAVSGRAVNVEGLGGLDSDFLIERHCAVVCLGEHLHLPATIRCCPTRAQNEALYLLAALTSAEALAAGSFPGVHGRGGAADVVEYCGGDPVAGGLLTIVEIARVIGRLRRRMPGSRRLIDLALEREFDLQPAATATDALLRDCLTGPAGGLAGAIRDAAGAAGDLRDAAERAAGLRDAFADAADAVPRALMFFPDFHFPASFQPAPSRALVADLADRPRRPPQAPDEAVPADRDGEAPAGEDEQAAAVAAAFVYPEWNQNENDYYEDWCFLRERTAAPPAAAAALDPDVDEDARRARRMFERLKPELARKEKFLAFGDEINVDLLVEHMALRRRLPAPRVRFYEKSFIRRRDLTVALLLDVSGSTAGMGAGETVAAPADRHRIIDLEKRAAITLGEGLDALGDRFAVYGFSGNGREHCDFFIYKELDEPFSDDARRRLLAAHPVASTRIGVALRHCREKLIGAPARRKLIILITDGRPQDSGYDPATRYAQYDVRMACQECARHDIHVVCISTLENSRADLEIMFPHRRYVILEDMSRLTDVLPALYLRMTA